MVEFKGRRCGDQGRLSDSQISGGSALKVSGRDDAFLDHDAGAWEAVDLIDRRRHELVLSWHGDMATFSSEPGSA